MKNISIESKFRSLIVVDIFPEKDIERFSDIQPGGIVVRRRHTKSPTAVKELIKTHQLLAEVPLLVAANFEWGVANDIRNCRSFFPGMLALSAASGNSLELAKSQGLAIGREARSIGVNTIFGPTIDVIQKDSSEVGTRGFSRQPEKVAAFAKAYIGGLQKGGVAAVAKHFPGGGNALVDAHLGLPIQQESLQELRKIGLKPFVSAIASNTAGVMMGHGAYPRITGNKQPGTMSTPIVDVLRKELGFKGFLITDNMGMGATVKQFAPQELLLNPILAGHDLVLIRSEMVNQSLLKKCYQIIRKNSVLQERIELAYERMRVIRNKWQMGKAWGNQSNLEISSRILGEKISRQAVTILRDPHKILPLKENRYGRILIVSPQVNDGFHIALASNFGYMAMELKKRFLESELLFTADSPTTEEQGAILEKAKKVDVVVLEIHDEQSLTGLAKGQIELCKKLMQKFGDKLIIAGLYSPLFLKSLPKKGAAVFAFSAMPASQVALAEALLGDFKPQGVNPLF